jgi:hypothetical protein
LGGLSICFTKIHGESFLSGHSRDAGFHETPFGGINECVHSIERAGGIDDANRI